MKDINSASDIKRLLDSFYNKVLKDDVIGTFFIDVVQLDIDDHMPVMYSFWESTLLGLGTYQGNPMIKHINLHKKMPIREEHFARWLELWESTINNQFQGDNADLAIQKANQIADLMKIKLYQKGLLN